MNKIAVEICGILQQNHFEAFLVGGCVRDTLLGLTPNDWDIATSAKPEQIKKIFQHRLGFKVKEVGASFGVVLLKKDDEEFEVATFRSDHFSEQSDGRHPDRVTLSSSAEEDAHRRDFTVNALFFEIPATELPPLTDKELDTLLWNIAVLMKRGVGDSHITNQGTSIFVDISLSELPALIKKRLEI